MKAKTCKLQTNITGQESWLRSWTFDKSDLTWNGSVSASLISPSSFEVFGRQVQDQTSTQAGNILSTCGNHANSTPVQVYATCMCLPKRKAKKHGHCRKKLAKVFDDYLAKEGCLEDPFAKQILRNYQPCVSTPKTPEHHKERVNQKNTVYHKSCPRLFILQLRRNIPLTTMTLIVLCFEKSAMERNA